MWFDAKLAGAGAFAWRFGLDLAIQTERSGGSGGAQTDSLRYRVLGWVGPDRAVGEAPVARKLTVCGTERLGGSGQTERSGGSSGPQTDSLRYEIFMDTPFPEKVARLPALTIEHIRERCTAAVFDRGLEYFDDGAIGNATLHGYTLSGTCEGTDAVPYRVTAELTPTGIADTYCSCPYSGEGDCKHGVALLTTYIEAPETILSVDSLLAELSNRPRANLLRVLAELLKRKPELALVAQAYADISITTPSSDPLPFVTVYREQIDRIFGRGFLERRELSQALRRLEALRGQAESLAALGETDMALSILHALIRESAARYPDTPQKSELPRFVTKCTKTFAHIVRNAEKPDSIREHCHALLSLSFDADQAFTPLLTGLLEGLCAISEPPDLQATIERRLDGSPDRRAHVQLLLALYLQCGRAEEYVCLARSEGDGYRLAHYLFTQRRDDEAWEALRSFPLSVDECQRLLGSPIVERIPRFTEKLLDILRERHAELAIKVYDRVIERTALSRKRADFERVRDYLIELKGLYLRLDQEKQWRLYLSGFRTRYSRWRLLLEVIGEAELE